MASAAVQNPLAPTESKSARKKKAKAERTESPPPVAATPEKAVSVAPSASQDDAHDSQVIRELQKNIRNVNKKITNLVKIETVVAEHKDKSLDELVSAKVINADQKASLLKKPALQSQLAQYEEQLAQHKKVEAEHRAHVAELQKSLAEKAEKEKAAALADIKQKAEAEAEQTLRGNLLVLSQFLRLAAARRGDEEADSTADENMALEGVLLHVYSGDNNAVETMLKLVQGAEDHTTSTSGDVLQTTFAQVKKAAIEHAVPLFPAEAAGQPVDTEASDAKEENVVTDPTVANAGLTEIEEGSAVALTNGHAAELSAPESAPSNTEVADSAANAAAESQEDTPNEMSQSWVDVKKEAESEPTEAPAAAPAATTPAAPTANQSWADESHETHEAPAAAGDGNDGFHQVQRNRGNREGGHRGGRGGDRGGHRGRGGYRGDGRGRGRGRGGGGDRGDRGGMASRRPRGGDEH